MTILSRRAAILGGLTALCAPAIIRSPGILMPVSRRHPYLNVDADELRRLLALAQVVPRRIAQEIIGVQPMPHDMLYNLTQALKAGFDEQQRARAGCFEGLRRVALDGSLAS